MQTFNPEVQRLISRRQDNAKTEANLRWLRQNTQAHLHVDLIVGLPGEDMESCAAGFDRLVALHSHEIQVGMLKRLRGAPICRHTEAFGLRFFPHSPYEILATDRIPFADMRRLARFARYWDLIGNSGRFLHTLPLLLGKAPFTRFLALGDWLWQHTRQTHGFALERLFDLLHRGLPEALHLDAAQVEAALALDYRSSRAHGTPAFLRGCRMPAADQDTRRARQLRHQQAQQVSKG